MKAKEYRCPQCNTVLQVMLFLGVEPDGFVCPECKIYYGVDKEGNPTKPLAQVI